MILGEEVGIVSIVLPESTAETVDSKLRTEEREFVTLSQHVVGITRPRGRQAGRCFLGRRREFLEHSDALIVSLSIIVCDGVGEEVS